MYIQYTNDKNEIPNVQSTLMDGFFWQTNNMINTVKKHCQ